MNIQSFDCVAIFFKEPVKSPECQNYTVVKYIEQNDTVVNFTHQIYRPLLLVVVLLAYYKLAWDLLKSLFVNLYVMYKLVSRCNLFMSLNFNSDIVCSLSSSGRYIFLGANFFRINLIRVFY